MKISARNRFAGRIVAIDHGVTTTTVKIDVIGSVVTASITKASADEMQLAVGQDAIAIIKSSDVIIGLP